MTSAVSVGQVCANGVLKSEALVFWILSPFTCNSTAVNQSDYFYVTIQQNTFTQSLSDYFNVSKFYRKLGNSA